MLRLLITLLIATLSFRAVSFFLLACWQLVSKHRCTAVYFQTRRTLLILETKRMHPWLVGLPLFGAHTCLPLSERQLWSTA